LLEVFSKHSMASQPFRYGVDQVLVVGGGLAGVPHAIP